MGLFDWNQWGLLTGIYKSEAKTITQYNMKGNKVAVYPSTQVAKQAMNTKISAISQAAAGKLKTAKGFIWRYGDGPDKITIAEKSMLE